MVPNYLFLLFIPSSTSYNLVSQHCRSRRVNTSKLGYGSWLRLILKLTKAVLNYNQFVIWGEQDRGPPDRKHKINIIGLHNIYRVRVFYFGILLLVSLLQGPTNLSWFYLLLYASYWFLNLSYFVCLI